MEKVNAIFQEFFRDLKASEENEINKEIELSKKIEAIYDDWKKNYDEEEEKFRDKLVELRVSSYQALSSQLGSLKSREFYLEKKVLPTYEEVLKKVEELKKERDNLLDSLEKTRKAIHEKRKEIVKQMSKELEKGDVKIEINPEANRAQYFDLLDEVYLGSDIYRRKEQLQKICLSVTPKQLVDFIRSGDVEKLIESYDITEDTAKKIVQVPKQNALFKIQTCPLQDELVVFLRKAEGEDFSLLKDLSYGEKCTAIFSIALIGKKKPLLVDQPVDELDHAFIIKNIVEHIRGVKEKRQLLIATHNANIPVLGDAELIFKVTKIPGIDKC